MRLPKAVSTITPQRISFIGGGTDISNYYLQHGGEVISSAIDKYIYVTIKKHSPLFNEAYRLSYSQTEHVQSINDIQNDVARECLRLVEVNEPLYIATAADLPASSGLGSSSSFAVGLLNALHAMRGERVSPGQLAEEACSIEIDVLKNPIGKQDQYASAFGGINHIRFKKNSRVEIDHLVMKNGDINHLFENSLLIWTGMQRNSKDILGKQKNNMDLNIDRYSKLVESLPHFKDLLLNKDPNFLCKFGSLLEDSWLTKQSLDESISSLEIEKLHRDALNLGSLGGKLCGAGGGGFMFEIVPKGLHAKFLEVFGINRVLKVGHEPLGSRVVQEVY